MNGKNRNYVAGKYETGQTSQLLILAAVVVVVLVGTALWLSREVPQEVPAVITTPLISTGAIERQPPPPLPEPAADIRTTYALEGELPLLGESDDTLIAHLRLLAGALPVSWLSPDQLIQKIVVEIDNIAAGDLIYQHSPVIAPPGGLAVIATDDAEVFILDQSSYTRYNLYADFLADVDQDLLAAFYRYYEPLLDQAYIKLGNAPGSFRERMVEALEEVLAAPQIEGEIRLTRPLLSYEYEDPALESLSMVAKQLIRMGPENTQKIQEALRPLKELLD